MERHVVGSNEQEKEEKAGAVSEAKGTSSVSEKNDPYAHMFAEWDLVPPQVVIRRIRRNTQ